MEDLQGKESGASVLVLGGGMAGIAAAAGLAAAGKQPWLIESRPYTGGRIRSFRHAATGDEIDNGQHLMMGCYHETFRLLTMLGTRDLVDLQPSLQVQFRFADGSRELLSAPRSVPAPLNLLVAMLRLHTLPLRERLGLLRVPLAARFGRISAEETVRQFLVRLGQPRLTRRLLWEPMAIATLNTPPDKASARLFAEVLRRGFLGTGADSHLAFSRTGLSQLVEPIEGFVEKRGGKVLTGNPIVRIRRDINGAGFLVRLKNGEEVRSDQIISALPPHALQSVLTPDLIEAVGTLPSSPIPFSPIVSLYLWFDRNPPELPPLAALIGTRTQWLFNRRRLHGDTNDRYPGLVSCTISAAFEETTSDAAAITATAVSELQAAFPELRGAALLDSMVVKEKQATFAATPPVESLRPGPVTALPGFFLAGDWTATNLPGTIEGAVLSGFLAARRILS